MGPITTGKMCPRLTAALVMRNGPGLASIPCGEDACQWWWKCREPQAEAEHLPPTTPGHTRTGIFYADRPQANAVPDIDDGRIEEYADLEAMAKRLVNDFMVTVGNPSLGNLYYPHLEALALKALREARDGVLDNPDCYDLQPRNRGG